MISFFRKCFLIFILIPNAFAVFGQPVELGSDDFESKAGTHVQLVDVRTVSEFRKGHIAGATNFDFSRKTFQAETKGLDKSRPVLVYCLSGGRSAKAAEYLHKQGFEVYELKGGMIAWNSAKKPVITLTKSSSGMTHEEFVSTISDGVVLVDFYAKWCGPCKKMAPDLEELKEGYAGRISLVKIDADANGLVIDRMNVQALPTLHLYKNGTLLWSHTGYLAKAQIEEEIKKAVN